MSEEWDDDFTEGYVRGESAAFGEMIKILQSQMAFYVRADMEKQARAIQRAIEKVQQVANKKFTATDRTDITP